MNNIVSTMALNLRGHEAVDDPDDRGRNHDVNLQAALLALAQLEYEPVLPQTVTGWTVRVIEKPMHGDLSGNAHRTDDHGYRRVVTTDRAFDVRELEAAIATVRRIASQNVSAEAVILFMKVRDINGAVRHVECQEGDTRALFYASESEPSEPRRVRPRNEPAAGPDVE